MAVTAEQLNIIMTARDREFRKAMDANARRVERFSRQSQAGLSKTGKSFDALGMAAKRLVPILAAVAGVGALKSVVSQLDEIGKKADQIGLTTDALQEMRSVAESAGVSQGALDSSLERFSKRLGEAVNGTGAAKTALEGMGLAATDLTAIPLDEAVELIADEMGKMESPTERAAAAAALFGREGVAMVNLLREGSKGMQEMRQQARDLGIVIDEDLVRGAEEAQTKLDLMGRVINAQLSSALVELAPLLVGAAESAANMARTIREVIGDVVEFADVIGISDLLGGVSDALGLTHTQMGNLTGAMVSGAKAVRSAVDASFQLENAVDEVVDSMAVEISQAEALDIALGSNQKVSIAVATQKLKEAETRHENARAAIAEAQAVVAGERAVLNANARVADNLNTLASIRERTERARAQGQSGEVARLEREAQIIEMAVSGNRDQIERLSEVDKRLTDHFDKTGVSVERLKTLIAEAKDGVVEFGDGVSTFLSTDNDGVAKKAVKPAKETIDDVKASATAAKKAMADLGREKERLAEQDQRTNEALAKSLTTAALNASSLEDALKKVIIQLVEISASSFISGALGGSATGGGVLGNLFAGLGASAFGGGGASIPGSAGASGVLNVVPGATGFAKGDVFNKPTSFAFGNGKMGVMGEAGPEAVMPLMRGPGGKLGVQASGGGGKSSQQSVHVTVDSGPEFDVKIQKSAEPVAARAVSQNNQIRNQTFRSRMMATQSEIEKDYR